MFHLLALPLRLEAIIPQIHCWSMSIVRFKVQDAGQLLNVVMTMKLVIVEIFILVLTVFGFVKVDIILDVIVSYKFL
jgi:hypothetical protein